MRGFEMYLYYHLHEHYRLIDLRGQSFSLGLLTALLMDFGYYWIHRANHGYAQKTLLSFIVKSSNGITWYILTITEINILWAHHQVHHSSDDFSVSVGLRHGIFNNWLSWVGFVKKKQHLMFSYLFYFCRICTRCFILPLLSSSHHLNSFFIYK